MYYSIILAGLHDYNGWSCATTTTMRDRDGIQDQNTTIQDHTRLYSCITTMSHDTWS